MTESNKYDLIVIGAGHNGLTAAIYLAQKGKKVLVIEKNDKAGGLASAEAFYKDFSHSGILHDCSQLRWPLIKDLNLLEHGMELSSQQATYTLLSKDGKQISISGDLEESVRSIGRISSPDAESYRDYREFIQRIRPFMVKLFSEAPPDLRSFGTAQAFTLAKKGLALKKMGKKTLNDLLRLAPMSVQDLLDEYFNTDFLKAGLSIPAIKSSFASPRSSLTSLNMLIWECNAGFGISGGPSVLIEALYKSSKNRGVDFIFGDEVEGINLDSRGNVEAVSLSSGKRISTQYVVSSVSPSYTLLQLIDPTALPYKLEREAMHYRSRGTSSKLHLALRKGFHTPEGFETVSYYRMAESFMDMEKAWDPVKYRDLPEEPVLDVYFPTVENPGFVPENGHVASVEIYFTPYDHKDSWNKDVKTELYHRVMKQLDMYFPNISSHVLGFELLSPVDLEEKFNVPYGHLYHGEQAIDQLMTRPFPSCSQYATPIQGLFFCGSGTYPGGGITCAPGVLAAERILKNVNNV